MFSICASDGPPVSVTYTLSLHAALPILATIVYLISSPTALYSAGDADFVIPSFGFASAVAFALSHTSVAPVAFAHAVSSILPAFRSAWVTLDRTGPLLDSPHSPTSYAVVFQTRLSSCASDCV